MSKTSFSKSELCSLHHILLKNKLLPCEKICVITDVFNSGYKNIYTIMKFVNGKKQLAIGLVTRTYPRTQKIRRTVN